MLFCFLVFFVVFSWHACVERGVRVGLGPLEESWAGLSADKSASR